MTDSAKIIPTLTSERLLLRPFKLSDAKEVQRQAGNPKVAATTATIPHPYLDGMAEEWISKHNEWFEKGLNVAWAIEIKESKTLIGCISLGINRAHFRAEMGYWIGEEFWNKGYCSEAAVEAIRYGFKVLKLNKIVARHVADNPGSGRVMLKAGMVQEAHLAQDCFKDGKFHDMLVYGFLREKFEA